MQTVRNRRQSAGLAPRMIALVTAAALWAAGLAGATATEVRGRAVDAHSGEPLACRLEIQAADGSWHFPRSAAAEGTAVEYRRTCFRDESIVEMHTTLSAHDFVVDLPPGRYELRAERGKEFLPAVQRVEVGERPGEVVLKLQRWIDLAALGWYSGDTHVHRPLAELPNLMEAEDLNVAFPLIDWVREAFVSPVAARSGEFVPPSAPLLSVGPQRVLFTQNTEYELFSVGDARHTLGAFFVLNHPRPLTDGAPPVRALAEQVHAEGALLDLDKHNWPWSMTIVPLMNVDLYELANNHVWRARFGFPQWGADWGELAPAYMRIEQDAQGFTEWGWIDFTLQNYYALVNCGYRLRPTGGTGSGVHPVPLGFGRVYVRLDGEFAPEKFYAGLSAGRSFVSTGPLLLVTLNGADPGAALPADGPRTLRLAGQALSPLPLDRIEVLVNGETAQTLAPANTPTEHGGYASPVEAAIEAEGSVWVAVRCFARLPDGRLRYAHTSPWYSDVEGQPIRPRLCEVEFLRDRVAAELARSEKLLPPAALEEYRAALVAYERLLPTARP